MAEHGFKTAAYITPYNPYSQRRTQEDNRQANAALQKHLRSRALVFFAANGADPTGGWPSEPGFLVLGLELEDVKRMGVFFRQNAIVAAGKEGVLELILVGDFEKQ
jgi:hypothetical protein